MYVLPDDIIVNIYLENKQTYEYQNADAHQHKSKIVVLEIFKCDHDHKSSIVVVKGRHG